MFLKNPALMSLCLLALVFAGCGGSPGPTPSPSTAPNPAPNPAPAPTPADDRGAVEHTMKTYLRALADKDGNAACNQLTADAQRQVITQLAAQLSVPGTPSCPDVLELVADKMGPAVSGALTSVKIAIDVHGDSATAGREGDHTFDGQLRRIDGRWLISKFGSP